MNDPSKFDQNHQKSARLQELYSGGADRATQEQAGLTHQQLRDAARQQHQQQAEKAIGAQTAERPSSRHMTPAQIREALQQHKTAPEQSKEQGQQIARPTHGIER
jgi:hypothetical protein